MFQAKILFEYWSDCVLTAVFLINRLPSPLLQDKSPDQMLTSKQPEYTCIRTFGCLCYVSTSSKNRHKFQPRAKACIFLGYSSGYKGYKVMDLDKNVISISRNIVFHEDIFPYHQSEELHDIFGSSMNDDMDSSPTVSTPPPTEVSPPPVVVDSTSTSGNQTVSTSDPAVSTSDQTTTTSDQKRSSKAPSYLQDYYCNMTEITIPYPLAAHVSYEKLSATYKNYICSVMHHPEQSSFAQAKKFDEWIKAMNEELIALESTDTWEVVSLLDGKHAIGCRWVYKVKLNADGALERYKAQLVARDVHIMRGFILLIHFLMWRK